MADIAPKQPSIPSTTSSLVDKEMSRRSFLKFGWAAFAGFLATSAGASLRFIFPNVLYEPPETFRAGKPEDFSLGVSTKWTKSQRVWIVRNTEGIYAIWARCTHLGCTPNWFQAENRFRCPCHGSNYTNQGDVIAGPAPKPMYRCSIRLLASGEMLIDKSVLENRPGLREKSQFFLALGESTTSTAKA